MRQDRPGHVYLVGAGPGPADLLTVRAQTLLRLADVLAYDDLVHPSLLELVGPRCQLLAIGYRAGNQHERPPPLHPEVLARAREGQQVVRLKSGDPMIFARGGEEAAALAAAGIAFSVVPGITAALAAAAACHLPLTWRGLSSELRISTQSLQAQGSSLPSATAAISAPSCTWALYMPRQAVRTFAQKLIHEGTPADTPAAFVIAAAHSQQRCLRSSLGALADRVAGHPSELPGIVIIGESLRHALPYQDDQRALSGCRILVARSHADPSPLVQLLQQEGADVWQAPWILSRILPPAAPRISALLADHEFIVVPSRSAWKGFWALLRAQGCDLRRLSRLTLITVGAAKKELEKNLLYADISLSHRRRLLQEWPAGFRSKGLILSAGEEGEEIQASLQTLQIKTRVLLCAHFEIQFPRLPQPLPDVVVAPHQKALRCLLSDTDYREALQSIPLLAFGEKVAQLAQEFGFQQVIQASGSDYQKAVPLISALWRPIKEYQYGTEGSADSLHGAWQG